MQPLWVSPASPKAQPQDAAEGSFLSRDSRAPFSAAGSLSCFHRPRCHLPFLACWPHALAKHCQPLAEPWWSLALFSLAVPEKQPSLCSRVDWGCLLLHYLAKGRVTSLWCHSSLLSPFCMASGPGHSPAQVHAMLMCCCAGSSLQTQQFMGRKTLHPSTAVVGEPGHAPTPWGTLVWGHSRLSLTLNLATVGPLASIILQSPDCCCLHSS